MKTYLLTSGSYSDYGVVALIEGSDLLERRYSQLQAEFNALVLKGIEPVRGDSRATFGSKACEDYYADIKRYVQDMAEKCEALGFRDHHQLGFADFLVKHHGYRFVEYKEVAVGN